MFAIVTQIFYEVFYMNKRMAIFLKNKIYQEVKVNKRGNCCLSLSRL
ncbi:hypothetical protein PLUTE_b0860 [Pseudoalteromonas luteoviolacea DSM 6061]|nr:hypothetical protein [Pseudoalteromonas luteoviolacea DSM 6061]